MDAAASQRGTCTERRMKWTISGRNQWVVLIVRGDKRCPRDL